MSNKYSVVLGLLASTFFSTHALSNPASTEYVKSSIDALRLELNTQSNARFNDLTTMFNQLSAKNGELGSLMNQLNIQFNAKTGELGNLISQLNIQLNQAINQSHNQDSSANSRIDDVQKQVNELPIVTHQVGDLFQGGVVFYVDSTQQHGLVVSLSDLGEPVEWRNGEGGDRMINAKGQGLGSGESNTRLVISEQTIDQQDGDFAALRAASYQISADGKTPCPATMTASQTCYGGWYLPSVYELVLLHSSLKPLGLAELKDEPYWSSSESNTTQAFVMDFATGELKAQEKSIPATIRAIHNF